MDDTFIVEQVSIAFLLCFFLPEHWCFFLLPLASPALNRDRLSTSLSEPNHEKDDARVTTNADGDRDRRRPAAGVVHATERLAATIFWVATGRLFKRALDSPCRRVVRRRRLTLTYEGRPRTGA